MAGHIPPELQEMMRQQRWQQGLQNLAQLVSHFGRKARGDVNVGPPPQMQGGGGGGGNLLQMMRMQELLERTRSRQEKERSERGQETQYRDLISGGSGLGPDGINWNTPRPGNPDLTKGMSPAQRGVLSSLPHEQGMGVLAKQAFPTPATLPAGMRATPEGGLENLPGYVAAQGELADAKRDPGGGKAHVSDAECRSAGF